ncbi:uL15 family ribosomal protein [Candidatus Micrarchaeota archaeon]|nr:uL15 family ribosomal protein [Candidatus Micrarchaeota archaeon]
MARRIKSRKSKHLGNRTFGGGNTKIRRGKGNRGGVGRAGYHKHRWLHTIKYEGTNKKAKGLHGFSNPTRKDFATVSLGQLSKRVGSFKQNTEGFYEIVLPRVKVLSGGEFQFKAIVKAERFSAKAKEKIEKSGGTTSTF